MCKMLSCLIGDVEIFISQGTDSPSGSFHLFTDKASWAYRPIRHEFGPADITAIINFIEELHAQLSNCAHSTCFQIAYRADDGQSSLTNAVFLAGCYMILMLDQSPDQVAASFKNLDEQNIEGYRDSSEAPADFFLTLNDCWRGLYRGKLCGWIGRPTSASRSFYGAFDRELYDHYNNPLNADLHEIIPRKLIAFRGPRDLRGARHADAGSVRYFSPEHYCEILQDFDVSTVIGVGEPQFDGRIFEEHGMTHHVLYCEASLIYAYAHDPAHSQRSATEPRAATRQRAPAQAACVRAEVRGGAPHTCAASGCLHVCGAASPPAGQI